MTRLLGIALAGTAMIGFAGAAFAAQPPVRINGQIDSLSGDTLHVKTDSGKSIDLMLRPQTHYVWVTPSSLSNIKNGDYVGVGATGPEDHMQALEVTIFPASMHGVGEGHHAWSLPAAVADADRHESAASTSRGPVHGSMTNGTVVGSGSSQAAPPVKGTMTNGTIAASSEKTSGEQLTISYKKGGTATIFVPADAPVVELARAQRSALKPGDKIFAIATKTSATDYNANSIAVGKNGLTPPM